MAQPLADHRIRPYRRTSPYVRTWLPSPAQVEAAARKLFAFTGDDFECVRSKVVGQAVAAALGAVWSPTLGMMVREALERMGGRHIVFSNKRLVCRIRPRHFDRAEAVALSAQLRGRKNLPDDDGRV